MSSPNVVYKPPLPRKPCPLGLARLPRFNLRDYEGPNPKRYTGFNEQLEALEESNADNVFGKTGHICAEVRTTVFQMNRAEFIELSGINRDTLQRIEEGRCIFKTYVRFLEVLEQLKDIQTDKKEEITNARIAIASSLAQTTAKTASALIIATMGYLSGNEVCAELFGQSLVALKERDRLGKVGVAKDNAQGLARLIAKRNAETDDSILANWKDPFFVLYFNAAVSEYIESRKVDDLQFTKSQKFFLILYFLVQIADHVNTADLKQKSDVHQRFVTDLGKGKAIPEKELNKLLTYLSESTIPADTAEYFKERASELGQDHPETHFVDSLWTQYERSRLTPTAVEYIFESDHPTYPAVFTRAINRLSINPSCLSWHALACLIHPSTTEVNDMMEEFFRIQRFSASSSGKPYCQRDKLIIQYGLEPEKATASFKFQGAKDSSASPEEIESITNRGEAASLKRVNRYLDILEPLTTPMLARSILMLQQDNIAVFCSSMGTKSERLHKILDGEAPPWSFMQRLMDAAKLPCSDELRIDWQLRYTEQNFDTAPGIGTALYCLFAQHVDPVAPGMYFNDILGAPDTMPFNTFCVYARGWLNGKRFQTPEKESLKLNNMITVLGLEPDDPMALWLKVLHEWETGEQKENPLCLWEAKLTEADRAELAPSLYKLAKKVNKPTVKHRSTKLNTAIRNKNRLKRSPKPKKESDLIKVLRLIPGVRRSDLIDYYSNTEPA